MNLVTWTMVVRVEMEITGFVQYDENQGYG